MNGPRLLSAIPTDFEHALKQARLHEFFLECAYVHRAGYLSWIATSVRPATRQRRIQQAVARLQAQRAEVLAAAQSARLAESAILWERAGARRWTTGSRASSLPP